MDERERTRLRVKQADHSFEHVKSELACGPSKWWCLVTVESLSQELGGDAGAKAVNRSVVGIWLDLKPQDWLDLLGKVWMETGVGAGTEAVGPFHSPNLGKEAEAAREKLAAAPGPKITALSFPFFKMTASIPSFIPKETDEH